MNISSKPTIFICEFITAGGFLGQALPETLAKEGQLMRDALIDDVAPYATVITTHDHRIAAPRACTSTIITEEVDVEGTWKRLISLADYVWFIAPETDGVLHQLTALAIQQNKVVIGSGLAAIEIASSKQQTYHCLTQHGISVVPTKPYEGAMLANQQWVIKPDDGVGCDHVYIGNQEALNTYIKAHDLDTTSLIVQPYLSGIPASISVISYQQSLIVLSYNLQFIEEKQGRLHYLGGEVNGAIQYQAIMEKVATQILMAIPSLQGYWGVDVMINPESNTLTVIEINPRLTTTYTQLKQAMNANPAKLIIETIKNEKWHMPTIKYNPVSFYV